MTHTYAQFRTMREKGESLEGEAKKNILAYLSEMGEETPEGHRTLPSERLRIGKKTIVGFKRQRRVSMALDADRAKQWLTDNGMLQEVMVTETVTYLNEDALVGLNFSGAIPDAVFKDFYTEKESFALVLEEGDDDEDDADDE
jgi:hypothetical protein